MTPLSQRDVRWKDIKIGKSTSSIGNYGCTLTCLAMLAGTTPDVVNTELTRVGGFLVNRIIWQKINETNLPLEFPDMGRAYAYDNDRVLEAINKNGGCLVEVDFDGIISTPNDRHWVLYIGNQRCIDPWTGNEVATSKYPLRKGFCVINIKEVDMLSDEQKRILDFIGDRSEGDVREAFGALADLKLLQDKVKQTETEMNSLKQQIGELTNSVKSLSESLEAEKISLDNYQTVLKTANSKIVNLEKQLETKVAEVEAVREVSNKYQRLYKEALANSVDKISAGELFKLLVNKLLGK